MLCNIAYVQQKEATNKNVTGNQKQRNRNTQTANMPCVTTANKEGREIP